ncbi:pentatricopeptide repeat-containing protein At1g08070, chloroplastic-like [Aristolochia californica]|uniref:pentatricopeptide repeat-containing protein At1g08070, chloroplastic-like n=1 Tax=Aristolochia californica TaxID=171875 RepID=UPI0035D5BF8A
MLNVKLCMQQLPFYLVRNFHVSRPHYSRLLFVDVLAFLETITHIRKLREIHACMIVSGFVNDPFAASQLLSSPGLSDFSYAFSIFRRIPEPNLFVWNTMIRKYRDPDDHFIIPRPFLLYKEMLQFGTRPNGHTFVYLMKSLTTRQELREGEEVHSCVVKFGFGGSQFVSSVLVGFYVACGILESGHKVFDEMLQRGLVLWTAIIHAYMCSNRPKEALELFGEMRKEGLMPDSVALAVAISACGQMSNLDTAKEMHGFVIKSGVKRDPFINSGLLCMYGDCGHLDLALAAFSDMPFAKTVVVWNAMIHQSAKHNDLEHAIQLFRKMPMKDVVSWNTIIGSFSRTGRFKEALSLFHEMETSCVKPSTLTLSCVLSACANVGALDTGIWVHAYAEKNLMNRDGSLDPALIDMYAKCGCVERALQVFEKVPREDLFSWTSIICGLAMHGHAKDALDLFFRMIEEGVQPDDVTLVAVLTACSHAGLQEQGYQHFQAMEKVYNILPKIEHYGCMVDLLGRMGHLREAYDLIMKMPMKPNAVIWGSLLSSCRVHKDVELGEVAAERMLELDPDDLWVRIMLSNIYAEACLWNQVTRLRKELKEKGMTKVPGCSMIEVDGVVHEFLVGDCSHQQDTEIRFMLEKIEIQFKDV